LIAGIGLFFFTIVAGDQSSKVQKRVSPAGLRSQRSGKAGTAHLGFVLQGTESFAVDDKWKAQGCDARPGFGEGDGS
jgi:hypothetical protein